jgi:glutaredoxin 3
MADEQIAPKAVVYSTPTCPYCKMAKEYFDEKGVSYEDVDVAAEPARAEEMVKKSGQMGVPVIDIGGTIIVGFDKEKINAALAA